MGGTVGKHLSVPEVDLMKKAEEHRTDDLKLGLCIHLYGDRYETDAPGQVD